MHYVQSFIASGQQILRIKESLHIAVGSLGSSDTICPLIPLDLQDSAFSRRIKYTKRAACLSLKTTHAVLLQLCSSIDPTHSALKQMAGNISSNWIPALCCSLTLKQLGSWTIIIGRYLIVREVSLWRQSCRRRTDVPFELSCGGNIKCSCLRGASWLL